MTSQEERRQSIGQRIRADLSRSLMPERKQKMLHPSPPKGALPVQVGVGEWRGGGEAVGGGGIASPLSEVEGSRTYHEHSSWVYSNDYLIATEIRPLRSMTMTDANGAPIVFNFALPPEV